VGEQENLCVFIFEGRMADKLFSAAQTNNEDEANAAIKGGADVNAYNSEVSAAKMEKSSYICECSGPFVM